MDTQEVLKRADQDVIHAIRTVHLSQTQLNMMADQKANILVGAIAILMTFLFTRMTEFELTNMYLIVALTMVVALLGLALLFGIMVIRPRTRWARHALKIEEIPNPFFFGFFTEFNQRQYVDFMMQKLADNDSARELMMQDIYQLGQVLRRKYTLLKYAYDCAAAGIFVGLVMLILVMVLS